MKLFENKTIQRCVSKMKIPKLIFFILLLFYSGFHLVQSQLQDCASDPCLNEALCEDTSTGYQCFCVDGFAGDNCDVNFDDCSSAPCKNNATCTDGVASYNCTCLPGFTGQACQTGIDECRSDPCLRNGTCINIVNGYVCACVSPFKGSNCEFLPCETIPCENEGSCINDLNFNISSNGYACSCLIGFTGVRCEVNIEDCDIENDTSCFGNGLCVDRTNDYSCLCEPGWVGALCESPVDDCIGSECRNNATCEDRHLGYVCNCTGGYDGSYCERERDECSAWTPCRNGATWVDLFNAYRCECSSGWFGTNCTEEVNGCLNNPCENGAQCIDAINGFVCRCPPFYTGQICETLYNPCSSNYNQCQNEAKCVTPPDGKYRCFCTQGFTGVNCEINLNECLSHPCLNNGTCEDGISGYTCHCSQGWSGADCGRNENDCASQPCMNDATCVDLLNGFECECTLEYTGSRCSDMVNFCSEDTCLNGGACKSVLGGFRCQCLPPYTGERCLNLIDECQSDPCEHNGTCMNTDQGFMCTCPTHYTGQTCAKLVDFCASQPCLNGGVCRLLIDGWVCVCPQYLTGRQCTDLIDYCKDQPCQNEGTCINDEFKFRCVCSYGFKGNNCSEMKDFCLETPCQNFATCSNIPGGFSCVCQDSYTGDLCQDFMTLSSTESHINSILLTTSYTSVSSVSTESTIYSLYNSAFRSSIYSVSYLDTLSSVFKTSLISSAFDYISTSLLTTSVVRTSEFYDNSMSISTMVFTGSSDYFTFTSERGTSTVTPIIEDSSVSPTEMIPDLISSTATSTFISSTLKEESSTSSSYLHTSDYLLTSFSDFSLILATTPSYISSTQVSILDMDTSVLVTSTYVSKISERLPTAAFTNVHIFSDVSRLQHPPSPPYLASSFSIGLSIEPTPATATVLQFVSPTTFSVRITDSTSSLIDQSFTTPTSAGLSRLLTYTLSLLPTSSKTFPDMGSTYGQSSITPSSVTSAVGVTNLFSISVASSSFQRSPTLSLDSSEWNLVPATSISLNISSLYAVSSNVHSAIKTHTLSTVFSNILTQTSASLTDKGGLASKVPLFTSIYHSKWISTLSSKGIALSSNPSFVDLSDFAKTSETTSTSALISPSVISSSTTLARTISTQISTADVYKTNSLYSNVMPTRYIASTSRINSIIQSDLKSTFTKRMPDTTGMSLMASSILPSSSNFVLASTSSVVSLPFFSSTLKSSHFVTTFLYSSESCATSDIIIFSSPDSLLSRFIDKTLLVSDIIHTRSNTLKMTSQLLFSLTSINTIASSEMRHSSSIMLTERTTGMMYITASLATEMKITEMITSSAIIPTKLTTGGIKFSSVILYSKSTTEVIKSSYTISTTKVTNGVLMSSAETITTDIATGMIMSSSKPVKPIYTVSGLVQSSTETLITDTATGVINSVTETISTDITTGVIKSSSIPVKPINTLSGLVQSSTETIITDKTTEMITSSSSSRHVLRTTNVTIKSSTPLTSTETMTGIIRSSYSLPALPSDITTGVIKPSYSIPILSSDATTDVIKPSFSEPILPSDTTMGVINPSYSVPIIPSDITKGVIITSYSVPTIPSDTTTDVIKPSYSVPTIPSDATTGVIKPSYSVPIISSDATTGVIKPSYSVPIIPSDTTTGVIQPSYYVPIIPSDTTTGVIKPSYSVPIIPSDTTTGVIQPSYSTPILPTEATTRVTKYSSIPVVPPNTTTGVINTSYVVTQTTQTYFTVTLSSTASGLPASYVSMPPTTARVMLTHTSLAGSKSTSTTGVIASSLLVITSSGDRHISSNFKSAHVPFTSFITMSSEILLASSQSEVLYFSTSSFDIVYSTIKVSAISPTSDKTYRNDTSLRRLSDVTFSPNFTRLVVTSTRLANSFSTLPSSDGYMTRITPSLKSSFVTHVSSLRSPLSTSVAYATTFMLSTVSTNAITTKTSSASLYTLTTDTNLPSIVKTPSAIVSSVSSLIMLNSDSLAATQLTLSPTTTMTMSTITTTLPLTTRAPPTSCARNTCLNAGTCREDVSGTYCDCNEGFIGRHCEIVTTACQGFICENGGKCTVTLTTYDVPIPACNCVLPFSGTRCDIETLVYYPSFIGSSFLEFAPPIMTTGQSNEIYISVKTIQSDGTIFYSTNQEMVYKEAAFVRLYLKNGMLHYEFSCDGFMAGVVNSDTAINTGDVYDILIRQVWAEGHGHWCSAALLVNTRSYVSSPILTIGQSQSTGNLFIGGIPRYTYIDGSDPTTHVIDGFIGCIKNLQINNREVDLTTMATKAVNIENCNVPVCQHNPCKNAGTCHSSGDEWYCSCSLAYGGTLCERKLCHNSPCYHGGTCVILEDEHDQLCLCPYGRGGAVCDQELFVTIPSFNGMQYGYSAYLAYSHPHFLEDSFEIQFNIIIDNRSVQDNLIMYMGNTGGRKDFMAIGLHRSYLVFKFDLGSGTAVIYSPEPLDLAIPHHSIKLGRDGPNGWLKVDTQRNVTGTSVGVLVALNTNSPLYVGGYDLGVLDALPTEATFSNGFVGCLYDLYIRNVGTDFVYPGRPPGHVEEGRNVNQCHSMSCDNQPCHNDAFCTDIGASVYCNCSHEWKGVFCLDDVTVCDIEHSCYEGSTCLPTIPGGHSCLCPLGKRGELCDEVLTISDPLFVGEHSYMALRPVYIKKSTHIQLQIKPLVSDGLVFYVAQHLHSNAGDFLSLSLNAGTVELRYDLGTGVNILTSEKVLLVDQDVWHTIKAGRNSTHGYIDIDGHVTVSMTEGMMSFLDTTSNLFLGGVPNLEDVSRFAFDSVASTFEGCVRELIVNGKFYELTVTGAFDGRNILDCDDTSCGHSVCKNGGLCTPTTHTFNCTCSSTYFGKTCKQPIQCLRNACVQGNCLALGDTDYVCDCLLGWTGPFCNEATILATSVYLSRASYIYYSDDGYEASNITHTDIVITFKTSGLQGLLLWNGQTYTDDEDFLGVGLADGRAKLVWNLGWYSKNTITSTARYNDDQWHTIKVQRNGRYLMLTVDDVTYDSTVSGDFTDLNTHGQYYIGGFKDAGVLDSTFEHFSDTYTGCIKDVVLHGSQILVFDDVTDGLNVIPCHSE